MRLVIALIAALLATLAVAGCSDVDDTGAATPVQASETAPAVRNAAPAPDGGADPSAAVTAPASSEQGDGSRQADGSEAASPRGPIDLVGGSDADAPLIVRAGPGLDWPARGVVPAAAPAQIVGRLFDREPGAVMWLRIVTADLDGWVRRAQVEASDRRIDGLPRAAFTEPTAKVLIPDLHFRRGPSTEAEVIRQFQQGEEVLVLGRAPDGAWLAVGADDGSPGWDYGWAFLDPTWLDLSMDPRELPTFAGGGRWVVALEGGAPIWIGARTSGWAADHGAIVQLAQSEGNPEGWDPTTGTVVALAEAERDALRVEIERVPNEPRLLLLSVRDPTGRVVASTRLALAGRDVAVDAEHARVSPGGDAVLVWDYDGSAAETATGGRPILLLRPQMAPVLLAHGVHPMWSAEGEVLYVADATLRQITIDGVPKPLGVEITGERMVLSPDKRLLAVMASGVVTVMRLDGTIVAASEHGRLFGRSWSPDSQKLALGSAGRGPLWVLDVTTGETVAVNSATSIYQAEWAPASDRIAVLGVPRTTGDSVGGIWFFTRQLRIYALDGTLQRVVARVFNSGSMHWSPDGRWLLFSIGHSTV